MLEYSVVECVYHCSCVSTADPMMMWQAHEGLGSVSFNYDKFRDAEKHFLEALKHTGSNTAASDRILDKLRQTVHIVQSAQGRPPASHVNKFMKTVHGHPGFSASPVSCKFFLFFFSPKSDNQ